MVQKYHVREGLAGAIPSILPLAAVPLTIVFGSYYDRKGKGASIMILGSLLLVLVHAIFTVPFLTHWTWALLASIILGVGFSLVPSAMWPSLPKFIPEQQLGTAYALIFWLQNLFAFFLAPMFVGWMLDRFCVVGVRMVGGASSPAYNYALPMGMFMLIGVAAALFALLLKAEDKAKGYGLELPCLKK
jgi:MFS family permease